MVDPHWSNKPHPPRFHFGMAVVSEAELPSVVFQFCWHQALGLALSQQQCGRCLLQYVKEVIHMPSTIVRGQPQCLDL